MREFFSRAADHIAHFFDTDKPGVGEDAYDADHPDHKLGKVVHLDYQTIVIPCRMGGIGATSVVTEIDVEGEDGEKHHYPAEAVLTETQAHRAIRLGLSDCIFDA